MVLLRRTSRKVEKKEIIPPTHLIACGVFKPALRHMGLKKRFENLRVTFLPSNLHMRPMELKERLQAEVMGTPTSGERIICLYGVCFPDIDAFCERHGIIRVPGFHCYEMLLGGPRYRRIIEETAGTYFLEKELLLNFEKYCSEPLELHDEEMRKCFFEHYKRLLYVRQPSDPDLNAKGLELASFLGLSLEIRKADYSHLETNIVALLRS